jgi:hypothetical protein
MFAVRIVASLLCGAGVFGAMAGAVVSASSDRSATPRSVTLDAPRHLTVLDYKPRVVLGWTYDGTLTTGFEVERAIVAGAPNARPDRFTQIGAPGREARRFRDPTSHAGMTYVYRIRAVGTGTMSPYSEIIVRVNAARR